MQLAILGPLEVTGVRGQVPLPAPRHQTVLAMLLLEANRVVPVERLVDAVWDENPPSTSKAQIQICVSALRRLLAEAGMPKAIVTRVPGYQFQCADARLDVQEFERLEVAARLAASERRLTDAAKAFDEALALWRGEPLAGVNSRVVRAAATRLEEHRLAVLEEQIDVRLHLGYHNELIGELMELVSEHPLRERLRGQLMVALYRAGRRAEALEVYRTAHRTFVDELGLEPGDELRQLERAILSGDSSVGISAEALQIHIKPSTARPATVPRMLPPDIADFTGRRDLVKKLSEHLSGRGWQQKARMAVATIGGMAGVGKTSLAIHVAHRLCDAFPDGQLYAKLDGATNRTVSSSQVLARFLRMLGVRDADIPEGIEERSEIYRTRMANRRVLVLIENPASEQQLLPLLPGSPSCAVIVTSRLRLTGLPGAFHVDVDVLDVDDATRLLTDTVGAERINAERDRVLELVNTCGRLPLALRIAAARLAARPHWSVAELAERLADEGRRLDELVHDGLAVRASIALTYNSLSQPAKSLLQLLSMLEVADFPAWVALPLLEVEDDQADDLVERLVDTRMLEVQRSAVGVTRYRFHELVRAYAQEQLVKETLPRQRFVALQRLLGVWAFLGQIAHLRQTGSSGSPICCTVRRWPLPSPVVDRLLADPCQWYKSERAAIAAVVRQAAKEGHDECCWNLALTAAALFRAGGDFDHWRITTELALAVARRANSRIGEAAILHSQGALHVSEHRFDDALECLETAAWAFRDANHVRGEVLALRDLAVVNRKLGRIRIARTHYEHALTRLRQVGDRVDEAHILSGLVGIGLDLQDYDTVDQLLAKACDDASASDWLALMQAVCHLAELQMQRSEIGSTESAFRMVLDVVRLRDDRVRGRSPADGVQLGPGRAISACLHKFHTAPGGVGHSQRDRWHAPSERS